jgi:hypothetical protein
LFGTPDVKPADQILVELATDRLNMGAGVANGRLQKEEKVSRELMPAKDDS